MAKDEVSVSFTFDGHQSGWAEYEFKMLAYLAGKGWLDLVLGEEKAARDKEQQSVQLEKLNKAYSILVSSLQGRALHLVMVIKPGPTAAPAIWKTLHDEYARNTRASRLQVRREFLALKLGDSSEDDPRKHKKVATFASEIEYISARLENMSVKVTEEERLAVLLNGLPKEYFSVATTLELNEAITFKQAVGTLADFQLRLKAEGVGRSPLGLANSAGGGDGKDKDKCFYCKEPGHRIADCPKKQKKQAGASTMFASSKWTM
jgi:hypothetical protein